MIVETKNEANEDDGVSGEDCGDCLDIRKMFIASSPRIVVWSAFEEAAKHHRSKDSSKIRPFSQEGYISYLVLGCFLTVVGVASLIWTPYDFIYRETLEMRRGLPPFEWWKTPPDEVYLSAYTWNVTNSEQFMRGEHDKLIVQEVGPFIFSEKLYHENPVFNGNGTLSYLSVKKAIFRPELNFLSLNDTITVPNLAVMGAASYLSNAPYFTKFGFNVLLSRTKSTPFRTVSVYDYFWNFTDPMFEVLNKFAPALVPTRNAGILHTIYKHFSDEVTVRIGEKGGRKQFFHIDQYNGNPGLQKWDNSSCDSVQGSTEGVFYHHDIDKNDTIYYLRKTICRAIPLYFTDEIKMNGMTAYKFELKNNTFGRPPNPEEECYRDPSYPLLPEGLTDISPCYYNLPMASSFPHFMNTAPSVTDKLEGLAPSWEKHGSAIIVEPHLGVPFTAWARSQCSLVMHTMSGFPSLKKFSNMAIPMFWLEYKQRSLPNKIIFSVFAAVKICLPFQAFFSWAMIGLGLASYILALKRLWAKYFGAKSKGKYSTVATSVLPK